MPTTNARRSTIPRGPHRASARATARCSENKGALVSPRPCATRRLFGGHCWLPYRIPPMSSPMDVNREHWDEATEIHARGNVYGLEDFKAGRCQLHRIEVEELGDVTGKRL